MTSRISYSKPSRENRKRMLGMTIITVLTFFIKAVFLVMGVNECSSHTEVLRLFQPNMGMASVVIVLAACSAAVSLYYLHSRKQTDFYESLLPGLVRIYILQRLQWTLWQSMCRQTSMG